MLLIAVPALAQEVERGPVGHYRFDEGEGMTIADQTDHGRDATILNDGRGVEWVDGRSGKALQFDGGDSDQRNVAGAAAIAGLGDIDWSKGMTVELWLHLNQFDRPKSYEIVSNTISDRGPGWRLMFSWLALRFASGEGGAGETWGANSTPADTRVEAGQWYHLAATYDGSQYRIYLDGALVAESEADLAMTGGDDTVYIGAYRGGYAYGLNGIIDDLKLYDYARTPEQIVRDAKLQ
jgi:hypothetical protein